MDGRSVHFRLLGGFGATVDEGEIDARWPHRRAAELVQLLALAPRHRLTRDQVIDTLWPHLDAASGAANLRKAAHHARRALGADDAVVLRQQTVALFPDVEVTTDAHSFECEAREALGRGDAAMAAEVAARYAGELLPDARYEAWADEPRRTLAQLHLSLLAVAGQWELLAKHDPLNEAACRALMRAALAAGQRHRAVSLYGRLRSALRHQLGVLPEPETDDVYQQCLRGLARTAEPFVGRSAELAIIEAQLVDGRPGAELVLVRGPAGIGKSALCREVAARAGAAGWTVAAVSGGGPSDAYTTLAAIVEQLLVSHRSLAAALDPKSRSVLAVLTPALLPADPLVMGVSRHQVIGAVQRLLTSAAGDGGIVVVVDDAEQADESSLAALAHLGDRRECPIVLVLACRHEAATETLRRNIAKASRTHTAIAIDLGPLDRDEVGELTRAAGTALDPPNLDALLERSEGNPFFVLELARAGAPLPHPRLGATLRDAIEGRFVTLDDDVVGWLRRLAIVGGALDVHDVQALTGCDDDDVHRLLDEALHDGVLLVDEGAYRFRHDLVRVALAEPLAPHQRAAVHSDAARRLVELGARPGRIGFHWLEAGRPDLAVDWLVRAADDAIRVGGYAAAVEHLDVVLAHAPHHPHALRTRAEALDALGDTRAVSAYASAIAVVSADEAHEIRPLQALAQIKQGDPEGALVTIAGAEPKGLHARLARALTYSGAAALGVADPVTGTALAEEGRRLAIESGDTSAIVVASWAHAAAAHARGELRDSLRTDLYETHAIPRLAVTVFDGQLCITQRLLYGARPYADVIKFADEFAAEASRLGAARGIAFATTLRGEAELLSGRLDAADDDLREGCRRHGAMGAATGLAHGLQRRAELALWRGDRHLAMRLLDDALDVARESDIGFHLLDRVYGTRILLADDPEAALQAVKDAEESVLGPIETCPGCRITLAVPAAIAVARAGDLERLEAYEQSCEWLADVVMRLPAWDAALEEVRGHRCLAHGDAASARSHFEAAATTFAAAGQPIDRARCVEMLVPLGR